MTSNASTYLCRLDGEALVHLRGGGIAPFLQGQLTCDTRKLGKNAAVSGAYCNPKGRVISDLWVLQLSETHCLIRLRRSVAAHFCDILRRFAQFSRISVDVDGEDATVFGAYGDLDAPGLPALPQSTGTFLTAGGLIALRCNARQAEWLALDATAAQGLADAVTATPGTAEQWEAETLRAGHYAIELDDSELHTPQALNYDLSGRVAFDKGCYTGQEVVARLHYKGKSKRRLQVLSLDKGALAPPPGTAILAGETGVGKVMRSAVDYLGVPIVASEMLVEAHDQPLRSAAGQALHLLADPTAP